MSEGKSGTTHGRLLVRGGEGRLGAGVDVAAEEP
jgi:hypothetical protein